MSFPLQDIKSKKSITGNYVGRVLAPHGHEIVERNGNPKLGPALSWQVKCGSCGTISTVMQNAMHTRAMNKRCKFCPKD